MRLLFITSGFSPESADSIWTYTICLAPALVARGHEVHVLVCAEGQAEGDALEQGVHVHRRGLMRIPRVRRLGRWLRLKRTLERTQIGLTNYRECRRLGVNFDVIEFPDWNAAGWALAILPPAPLVAQLHGLPLIWRYGGRAPSLDVRWASSLEWLAVHRAHVVASPSSVQVQEHRNVGWFHQRQVEIIPLAIDWTAWHDASPVAHTRPVVLFVGRVEGWKAPETLVRAMSLIRQAMPESEALFVGRIGQRDGMPYTEWLERTVGGTDGCRFLGPVPRNQIKAMLSMSRILALPSQFDAFGLVVLEAMSAGRPVVVSASAGSAEFVERAGGGVVVPPGDPAALAKGLLQFLRDPSYAAEVGERARAAVRRWLSPEKIAARREAMYEQAMRSFGRRRASPVDTTWLKGPVN